MDPSRARTIAEHLHARDRDPDGTPVLAHIGRVVRSTPIVARTVAWLHEALEVGGITEHELLADGLTSDELRALRLLSPSRASRSDDAYLAHLDLIALADGLAGNLARAVKIADLRDRSRNPRVGADGWTPPYDAALSRLTRAGARIAI